MKVILGESESATKKVKVLLMLKKSQPPFYLGEATLPETKLFRKWKWLWRNQKCLWESESVAHTHNHLFLLESPSILKYFLESESYAVESERDSG